MAVSLGGLAFATGFWGKIPSRGDFVGSGLPRDLVNAWDHWMSAALTASRAELGEAWHSAWMEAPVWCFTTAAGLLGVASVSGLWLPSVDLVGREFPLLIATLGQADAAWSAAAEMAGRCALTDLLTPQDLVARLRGGDVPSSVSAGSHWWTDGAPRVRPCHRHFQALPGATEFAAMLDDRA
jgi:type VI secretion system protein ImpM